MTGTILTIKVMDGHLVDWMDTSLPTPTDHREIRSYSADHWNDQDDRTPYELEYALDGYFSTHRGKQYLHDIAGRIAYAVGGSYSIHETALEGRSYKLSDFDHLDRVPSYNSTLEANAWDGSRNEIFDALRHKAYRMHKTNTLDLDALTVYGNRISNGSEHIKYLAPNVFQWVSENYTGRQSIMSRVEAGINASMIKAQRVEDRIMTALGSSFFDLENLSISSMSRALRVTRVTMRKYLDLWRQRKRASEMLQRVSTPYVRLVYTGYAEIQKKVRSVKQWIEKEDFIALLSSIIHEESPPNHRIDTNIQQGQRKMLRSHPQQVQKEIK